MCAPPAPSSIWFQKLLLFSPVRRLGSLRPAGTGWLTQAPRPRAPGLASRTVTAVKRLPQRLELSHLLMCFCFLLLPLQTGFLGLQLPQLFVCVSQLLLQLSCSNAVPESRKHYGNVILHGEIKGLSLSQEGLPFPAGLAQGTCWKPGRTRCSVQSGLENVLL